MPNRSIIQLAPENQNSIRVIAEHMAHNCMENGQFTQFLVHFSREG